MPAYLHVYAPDTDAFYAQAVCAGAISVIPSRNAPYGDRSLRSKALAATRDSQPTYFGTDQPRPRASNASAPPRAVRRLMASFAMRSFPYSNTLSR